jgi:phosphatidylglycerol:prolipoprotein diacylglycerol transferase
VGTIRDWSIAIPCLSSAWLGTALVGSLLVAWVLPLSLRAWWLLFAAGLASASGAAVIGAVPWFGTLHLTAYAVCLVAAFICAYAALLRPAALIGMPEKTLLDIFLLALLGGVIGARIGEMVEQWPSFGLDHAGHALSLPALLIKAADIDGGGMVWYGGVLVASALLLLYAWQQRIPALILADLMMPALLLGLAIGRIGCFFNGCCYGLPTTLPWGVPSPRGPVTHPTQLYETAFCLFWSGVCAWRWRHRWWRGEVLALGILGYAAWRIVDESLRGDTVWTTFWGWFPATTSQVVSLDLIVATVVGGAIVATIRRRSPLAARIARHVPGSIHDLGPVDSSADKRAGSPPTAAAGWAVAAHAEAGARRMDGDGTVR